MSSKQGFKSEKSVCVYKYVTSYNQGYINNTRQASLKFKAKDQSFTGVLT